MIFRKSITIDTQPLEQLYQAAFPQENLIPLVKDLLDNVDDILSVVAIDENGRLVGHIMLTICNISDHDDKLALLGPFAVHPNVQRHGIGTALVKEAFDLARKDGISEVYVLGDPAYYGRYGFEQCHHVLPPYVLPESWIPAWQFINLNNTAPAIKGTLIVPAPWRQEKLWSE